MFLLLGICEVTLYPYWLYLLVTRLEIKVLRVVYCHDKTNKFCVPYHCTALTILEGLAALILSRSAPANQQ